MTTPTARARPTAADWLARAADWLARAAAVAPRNDVFIGGRFVPAASGATFPDDRRSQWLAHHRRCPGGRRVWVNTFDTADITVPFGGFKQSGFGRDKGMAALDGYTQLKTTWIDLSGK